MKTNSSPHRRRYFNIAERGIYPAGTYAVSQVPGLAQGAGNVATSSGTKSALLNVLAGLALLLNRAHPRSADSATTTAIRGSRRWLGVAVQYLALAAAAAVWSPRANAGTETVTGASSVIQLDFPAGTVVTVPGFKGFSSLAECQAQGGGGKYLTKVTVKLTANLSASGSVSNPQTATTATVVTVAVVCPFTLTLPDGSPLVATPKFQFPTATVSPGQTVPLPATGDQDQKTAVGSIAGWTGDTVSLLIGTKLDVSVTESEVSLLKVTSFGSVVVDVTYEWATCSATPPCTVCPPGATESAVGLGLSAFHINPDGTTGALIGGVTVGICQKIRLRMTVAYNPFGPMGGTTYAFSGGRMLISTASGSFTQDVTPGGGVPIIAPASETVATGCAPGGTPNFVSLFTSDFDISAHMGDIVNGQIVFTATHDKLGTIAYACPPILDQTGGSTPIQVNVAGLPSCTIAPAAQTLCVGSPVTPLVVTATGGVGPYTWVWSSSDDPGFSAPANSTTATPHPVGTGTFHYRVDVTDAAFCTSTCETTVTVLPKPTCTIAPITPVCAGAPARLTVGVSGGTAPFTINWTGPNGFTGSGPTIIFPDAQAINAGDYTAHVLDDAGCGTSCQAKLVVAPNPYCSIEPPAPICAGGTVSLTVAVTSGTEPFTINWFGPNGFRGSGPTITIPNAQAADAGDYTAFVTDNAGCGNKCPATLVVHPSPACTIQTLVDNVCVSTPGQLQVSPSGGRSPYTIAWSSADDASFVAPGNVETINPTPGAVGTFHYTAAITDQNGCQGSCTATLTTKNTPPSIVCPADTKVVATSTSGQAVTLSATVSDPDNCQTLTASLTEGANLPVTQTVPPPADNAPVNFALTLAPGAHSFTLEVSDGLDSVKCYPNVSVAYAWSGFLSPLPKQLFKAGSTIPIKFRLTGASAGIDDLVATGSAAQLTGGVPGPFKSIGTFRYDPVTGNYVLNWSTKPPIKGSFRVKADFGDGVERAVDVVLR